MEKILFINGCVRPNSRTLELSKYVLDNLSGEVTEVKLYDKELSPLSLNEMELRENSAKNKDFSHSAFSLAKQFAKADIILIDTQSANMTPDSSSLSSNVVYSANGSNVDTTICNGKILMENKKLTTLDEEEIYAKARQAIKELKEAI